MRNTELEHLKIGIIGAGNLGTAIAARLIKMEHEVMLSFSRDLEKLKVTAGSLGALAGRRRKLWSSAISSFSLHHGQ